MLDEMYRGYQDSRYVLDTAGLVPRAREAAMGMALVDGQLVAWMKRTLGKDRVDFALTPLRGLGADEVDALQEAGRAVRSFPGSLGTPHRSPMIVKDRAPTMAQDPSRSCSGA